MNFGTTNGRRTMASLAIQGLAVNQALASQTAWFIDPINGSDARSGLTAATAIKTRSEFFRRMRGVTLTQAITVTVMSDLAVTDTFQSEIITNKIGSKGIHWKGVPVDLTAGITTTISGYVARNGATNTVTQMTIAGLPVSWTASGLVGKVIEYDNGLGTIIAGVVIRDLGAKAAAISPPINRNTQAQGQVFANGQTPKVYQLVNFNNFVHQTDYSTYEYLTSPFFVVGWGICERTSCDCPTGGGGGDGTGLINHDGNSLHVNCLDAITTTGPSVAINGGYSNVTAAGSSNVRLSGHSTINRFRIEGNARISTTGQGVTPADVEIYNVSATTSFVDADTSMGGMWDFGGYVYGNQPNIAALVTCASQSANVTFRNAPTVTGATTIVFTLLAKTELLSRLPTIEIVDAVYNNRIRLLGTPGPTLEFDRRKVLLQARGVIAATVEHATATAVSVSGVASFMGVALFAGEVISNIIIAISGVATTPTLSKVGLYDKNGNQLAVSADQGVSWATTGMKTIALTAAYTVPTTDIYYVAILCVATTGPTVPRGEFGAQWQSFSIGGKPANYYGQTGLADLPNPATYATGGATVAMFAAELT